ncbi:tryptophan synthase subunit alpha [Orenia marismortui]|uniref:Tryptophan synthase alpha chain n=1 Tax=Orenia marismortui TaxID=46469 RepID=A0A4R8HG16_9FIRM|nr:tryptophan synthase subunit alpha [Orenia marismortui]TDX58962.1 tryptophan synthase alpha chain [Orenia marismortui]
MGRITKAFSELKDKGQKAFIPFLMAGDPTIELTKDLVLEAERAGANIIELGVPYATPLADGPTIQKAGKRSLVHKTNLKDILNLVKKIREESEIPLILMGYYNSFYQYGLEKLVKDCEEAGVDGVIIPDMPLGEDQELREFSNNLDIILLVAPNSIERRIQQAAENSQGFIYAVSKPGITGAREELSQEVEGVVEKLKKLTDTPVAVGFGISRPEHVSEISKFADGVIVGSAIIKQIEENINLIEDNKGEFLSQIYDFISELTIALK